MGGRKASELSVELEKLEVGQELPFKPQTVRERWLVYDAGKRFGRKFRAVAMSTGGYKVWRVA